MATEVESSLEEAIQTADEVFLNLRQFADWLEPILANNVIPEIDGFDPNCDVLSIGSGIAAEAAAYGRVAQGVGKFYSFDKNPHTKTFIGIAKVLYDQVPEKLISADRVIHSQENIFAENSESTVFKDREWQLIMLRNWQFVQEGQRPFEDRGQAVVNLCLDHLRVGGVLYITAVKEADLIKYQEAIQDYQAVHPGRVLLMHGVPQNIANPPTVKYIMAERYFSLVKRVE